MTFVFASERSKKKTTKENKQTAKETKESGSNVSSKLYEGEFKYVPRYIHDVHVFFISILLYKQVVFLNSFTADISH